MIALSVKLDDPVPLQEMTPHHWAFADVRFDMPPHWREWLGTIRTGFLKEARPAEPEPAQHSVYTQDPHKFLEDLVDRWIAADEAEKAEQRAERIAQGLPAEPASETEALQMRIAELEAENERLRGVLPSPEARAITPTESEVIPPGEIPDLDANKAPGWQKQSWTGPEDGTLSWLRPVPPVKPEDRPPATPPVAKSGDETKAQMARVNSDRSIEHRVMGNPRMAQPDNLSSGFFWGGASGKRAW